MGRDTDDQARPESIGLDSLPSSRRDVIDLNNDMAGREVGRAHRFISPASQSRIAEEKRERERTLSALMRKMQDPNYAALYTRAVDAVEEARRVADGALARLNTDLDEATQHLGRLRTSAAKLEDGTAVYRSTRDGRLYTEDGTDITDRADEVTGLSENSPTSEELQETLTTIEERQQDISEVEERVEEVLTPARERLEDQDNPATEEELLELISEIDKSTSLQSEVLATGPVSPQSGAISAATNYLGAIDLAVPEINESFARATETAAPIDSLLDPKPDAGPKLS